MVTFASPYLEGFLSHISATVLALNPCSSSGPGASANDSKEVRAGEATVPAAV